MEEYLIDGLKIGLFLSTHIAIEANRMFIKPNIKSDFLFDIVTNLEHIVSYITTPLAYEVFQKYIGISDPIPNKISAITFNIGRSIIFDALLPIKWTNEGKKGYHGPQWDQLSSNGIGTILYLFASSYINELAKSPSF